jgi:CheY-like chemotaxis protein
MTSAISITFVRFDVRQDHCGWTIYDRQTGEPASPIVLVVEDEALIRMLAHETLSEVGMHVLEAAHGGEALDLLQARPDVSVIFSDVNMPVLDGFSLARLVAIRWPHIPVLITSGKVTPELGDMPVGPRFLPKPYRPTALVTAIRNLLANAEVTAFQQRLRPLQ